MRDLVTISSVMVRVELRIARRVPPPENVIVLVPAGDAYVFTRRAGYRALSRGETSWHFDAFADRDPFAVRNFAMKLEGVGAAGRFLGDRELRALIHGAVERGELVGCAEGDGADTARLDGDPRAVEQRRLADRIAGRAGGLLNLAGRRYRLLAGGDWNVARSSQSFEVLPRGDAERILLELERQDSTPGEMRAWLAQARAALSQDWRPPARPDGVVLLRERTVRTFVAQVEGLASSPSELVARGKEKAWIEIVVDDELGAPYRGPVEIKLPNGTTVTLETDANGSVRLEGLDPGSCIVTLPELDQSSWSVA